MRPTNPQNLKLAQGYSQPPVPPAALHSQHEFRGPKHQPEAEGDTNPQASQLTSPLATSQPEGDLLQTNTWKLQKAQTRTPKPYINGQPRCLLPLFP